MSVAIIGLGNIGSTLARNFASGGVSFAIADHTLVKAEKLAGELNGRAEAMSVGDAINGADIVIVAVYFDVIKELLWTYRSLLPGKIVIDPSNPIAPDGEGGFKKTIPVDQSSGELIAALLPPGAELVKAFGTLGAASLASGVNRSPERAVLFYATDYPKAGNAAEKLIVASGFASVNIGGINQSRRIEVGGDLHEFGKLGKLVSACEPAALL